MSGVTIVAMFARNPELSHEAFVERYETVHVPLVRRLLPSFGSNRRCYIDDEGARAQLGFDVITEAWFASERDHQQVLEAMADPAIAAAISEDEAHFMDRDRSVMFRADERR